MGSTEDARGFFTEVANELVDYQEIVDDADCTYNASLRQAKEIWNTYQSLLGLMGEYQQTIEDFATTMQNGEELLGQIIIKVAAAELPASEASSNLSNHMRAAASYHQKVGADDTVRLAESVGNELKNVTPALNILMLGTDVRKDCERTVCEINGAIHYAKVLGENI